MVGGYFDEEFKETTFKLFERLENNEIVFVISDLLDLELINAPQQVESTYLNTLLINFKGFNWPKKL